MLNKLSSTFGLTSSDSCYGRCPPPPTEGLSCNFRSVNLGRFSAKVNHHPQTHQVDPYVHWMSYVCHPALDPESTTILPQLTFFDSWVNLWSSFILAHFFLILKFFKQLCFLMNVMIFFFGHIFSHYGD